MSKKTAIRTKHAPHFYVIFAVVAAAFGVIGTIIVSNVLAQGNEVIYACVNKVGGNIRIVTANESCKSNESSLNWNQQGPAGTPGSSSGSNLPFSCGYCVLSPIADKFKGKDLSNAQIWRSELKGADLTGTIFTGANMSNVDFSNSNLTGADFSGVSNYPGWSMTGVDFTNTNLTNVNFTNTNLSGARNMDSANTTGATWNNTKCPDGTNSNDNSNTCVGHF